MTNHSGTQSAQILSDAIDKTDQIHEELQEAAQALAAVKGLIVDAQIAQAGGEPDRKAGEGTASILAYFEGKRAQVREDEAKAEAKK